MSYVAFLFLAYKNGKCRKDRFIPNCKVRKRFSFYQEERIINSRYFIFISFCYTFVDYYGFSWHEYMKKDGGSV